MTDRLVVLHVIEGLGTGGAEQQLAAFVLRSNPTRFRHEVCTLAQVGRFARTLEAAGIPVHPLGLRPDGDMARVIVGTQRVVRRVNPHIIHTTLYRPTVAARIAGWFSGKIVVTTLVNTSYEPEWLLDNPRLNRIKAWGVRTIDRLTARLSGGHYVAITKSVKESAIRQLGLAAERIAVIPRGLPPDDEPEPPFDAVRGALGEDMKTASPLILNVGRLVPQKGQRYLILAMRRIVSKFPNARLLIAGEGWLRPALERLIQAEGLTEHVTLLGERRDIARLLRAADIFVFPSLFEGLGNAVLEAMAAGKPCIVSRIPALCEITENGKVALLADVQSPEDLAANILRLADSRDRAEQMGQEARAWVRERFRIEGSVAALEALYERLVMLPALQWREDRILPSRDP